ncbi:SEA/GATOR complex protein SEA3/WDR59, partial [Tremellales sp. Uapishka_1]
SRRSSASTLHHQPVPVVSPRTLLRPRLHRDNTITSLRQEEVDPFKEGSTISVNQPVGSLSISPSNRDICLASRKGLYILDLANLNNAPRFIPQGGTWQIADCQWSPHPATSNLILSTSSQKLLVWDLAAQVCLHRSIDAHARAITDINWHARNPNLIATVSMDSGIRGWDLRMSGNKHFMRLCAWGAAGTQVKWNRQHEHILATAQGNQVFVWDNRKGSVPVTVIKAHDAKIYGIDWDRQYRHKLVTCSLGKFILGAGADRADKTIKYWDIPELSPTVEKKYSHLDFFPTLPAPDTPTHTISTTYPIWRARNLPFGKGVLSLPQRGEKALDMFNYEGRVERFEGHDDVVKEFVWRTRGGDDASFEDREFQLITWSKDRTLKVWPIGREVTEKVGYQYGSPINILVSRRRAADITYTSALNPEEKKLAAPVVNQSGIAKQKVPKPEVGMTRGGGTKVKGVDQLEWLTKVVKNRPSSESSLTASRMGSESRHDSRTASMDRGEKMSLKDEVVLVNKMFPKPKINFEKIDLNHRKLTMTMNGPWANGDRQAFIRIHWSFSATYPYSNDVPVFELERNATVLPITRMKIISTIKEMRRQNRQCLVATSGFLLGYHERPGRRLIDEASDSESEKEVSNVPMLVRTCGASFGPNGQLVCFFPKQTVLPRAGGSASRSPSVNRDHQRTPFAKAMSVISRTEDPRKRTPARFKAPRFRRFEPHPAPVQSGSTVSLHDIVHLGHPDPSLAGVYSTNIEDNIIHSLEAKRLDHVEIWSTISGLLSDPPPIYSKLPELRRKIDIRRERHTWELGVARKKKIFDGILLHPSTGTASPASCNSSHHLTRNLVPQFRLVADLEPILHLPERGSSHSQRQEFIRDAVLEDTVRHVVRRILPDRSIDPDGRQANVVRLAKDGAVAIENAEWAQFFKLPSAIEVDGIELWYRVQIAQGLVHWWRIKLSAEEDFFESTNVVNLA